MEAKLVLLIDTWSDSVIERVRRAQEQHHAGFANASNLDLLAIESELRRLGENCDGETRTALRHYTLWVMTVRACLRSDVGDMTAADAATKGALEEAWTYESECRTSGNDCFSDQIIVLSMEREEVLGWTGRQADAILLLDLLWRRLSPKHPASIDKWASDIQERIDQWGTDLGYLGTFERLGLTIIDIDSEDAEQWTQPLPLRGLVYDNFDDEFRVLNERSQATEGVSVDERLITIEEALGLISRWLEYSPNSITVRGFQVQFLLMKLSLELGANQFARFTESWLITEPEIEQLVKVAADVTDLRRNLASNLQRIGRYARYRDFPSDVDYRPITNIGAGQLNLAFRIACIGVESRAFNQADAFLWIGLSNSFLLEGKSFESVPRSKRRWSRRWTAFRNLMIRRILKSDPNNDRARRLQSEFGEDWTTRSIFAWGMVNRINWNICSIDKKVL
jgi:hypothetical protein